MTAEDFEQQNIEKYNSYYELMVGFAEYKCKELLKIVVEKAENNFTQSFGYPFEDKESILNVVDLNEFIK